MPGTVTSRRPAPCSADFALGKPHADEAGLVCTYKLAKGGYAGIIKSLQGADWSACKGVQFWLVPDGKAQKLICQLNSNGEDFEVDLTQYAASTQPQLVQLPFSQFKRKNGGKLDAGAVQHFALYCNQTGDSAVTTTLGFDDIGAYR